MKIILEKNKLFELIFSNQEIKKNIKYRMAPYCIFKECEDGVLLFNNLSKELLLLSQNEYENMNSIQLSEYLKLNWYLIPEDINGNLLCEQLLKTVKSMEKVDYINSFTIMTTLECNARCFYCFQKGRKQPRMSMGVAKDVATYILKQTPKNSIIHLTWFGGEPLYNERVIDIISDIITKSGREISAKLVTNGYLLDENTVLKCKNNWHIKKVQVTLDGTEKIYNKTKNYIYSDKNPFLTVIKNIRNMLENGINVVIRLNLGLHNVKDLYDLVDFLSEELKGYDNLLVYTHRLFDYNEGEAINSSLYIQQNIVEIAKFRHYLIKKKLNYSKSINTNYSLHRCMADSDKSIVITPDGNITKCEHFSDKEFIGNIYDGLSNIELINSWKICQPKNDICNDCAYYIDCIRLKKCPDIAPQCDIYQKNEEENLLREMMLASYKFSFKKE